MRYNFLPEGAGRKRQVFIVAEISANHARNFNKAVALIKKAKECGADAVKFQAYSPETLTIDADNKYFRLKHPRWGGQTLYELYKKAATPWHWFKKLKRVASESGILFFATAFDNSSVDLLEELNVPFHKIASFEAVDLELIKYAAGTKKPLILSVGMCSADEIRDALAVARKAGAKDVVLLKCVSSYPAKPEEMNLRSIPRMRAMFKAPVGISDHTIGSGVSIAAVCLGAVLVEKHFTLSRKTRTPDSFFSAQPGEFRELVNNIRIAEKALGEVFLGLTEEEKKNRVFRRSLFAVKDIKAGGLITPENVRSIRPGYGLHPKYFKEVMGRAVKKDIKRGTPLCREAIA